MSDTFITLVAIILAAVLVIVVPLVATSERVDTVSQSDVETLTSNFVDEIRTTGKLTLEDYDKFLEGLTSTGNTYDVNLEFKILDENPGKKSLQTTKDKIGENVYYSIYTTQIVENYLENEQQKNTYNLKQGDIVSITVRNTNLTLSQQLKNFTYKVVGNDTYTISASKSGLVIGNGSTEVILANSVNENTIDYILRENNSEGKVLKDTDWTNQNVYVELFPTDKTYNLELLYYWRNFSKSVDYSNGYRNDGNNIIFTEKNQIQVYWKHSVLEKYSNIRTIDIKIDKISPTIGSVVSTGNTGDVFVSGCDDEGGSGLDSYYYTWINSKEDHIPEYPKEIEKWNREISNSFNIVAEQKNNGKYCVVWIKDKAGNVSAPAISDNPVKIAPAIKSFKLKNAMVKKGDKIKIQLENVVTEPDGNIIEYKNISYDIEDKYKYIATIDSNGEVTGLTPGKVQVNCYIENYDGTGVYGRGMITVVDVSYSPNGGKYIMPTTGGATIKTTVTMLGGNEAVYAWSSSDLECTGDVQGGLDSSKTSDDVYLRNLTNTQTCYLWTKVYDEYGNEVTYVSNPFVITAGKISINPNKTDNTNGKITCKITYPDGIIKETKRVGYGLNLDDAKNAANNTNTETITVAENGYVYAEAKDKEGNKITASLQITNIVSVSYTGITLVAGNSGTPILKYIEQPKEIKYSSSEATVATINATTGVVTGVKAGTAIITAKLTYNDGTTVSKTCTVTVQKAVAKVGTTYYSSITNAIAAITSGTVTLLVDQTETVTIPEGKTITLALNEKTITGNVTIAGKTDKLAGGILTVTGTGKITNTVASNSTMITNHGTATFNTGVKLEAKGGWCVGTSEKGTNGEITTINGATLNGVSGCIWGGGTIEVKAGTLTATGSKGDGIIFKAGTLNVTGGTIEGQQHAISSYGGTTNISGGSLSASTSTTVYLSDSKAVLNISGSAKLTAKGTCNTVSAKAKSGSTINVNGGTIESASGNAVLVNEGITATITGGTIKATAKGGEAVDVQTGGTANITGGTMQNTAKGRAITTGGTLTINGTGVKVIGGTKGKNATYPTILVETGGSFKFTKGTITNSDNATTGYVLYVKNTKKGYLASELKAATY